VDGALPPRTDEPGVDVERRSVIPTNTGDIMSYCDGERRWPSREVYDPRIFDALPVL
jgi:hypothetical protein